MAEYITLYDSTLRDGAQSRGVDFTVADKLAIARELDKIGIDYIEGGWPGANPNDDAFFAKPPALKKAKLSAFGMTRRSGRSAENDPGLATLLDSGVKSICLVGKSWDHQVKSALGITPAENLRMIAESIALISKRKMEALYDAEHFFDGYKANPGYALSCLKAAYDNGAKWIVLCDTNGGSLPFDVERIVGEVTKHIPGKHLGIHCHNDTDNAVANSLAAVRGGVRQVQGTINGIGERCGNANLISIIPNLVLKMGFLTGVTKEKLVGLTALSHFLDDRLNRTPNQHAPYVGSAAFAHKGGLHVSAMSKDSSSYEHIKPETVGNVRTVLVSDKAGRSNILDRLKQFGIRIKQDDERVNALVSEVKAREKLGYAYEGAEASFELLVRQLLGTLPQLFEVTGFRVIGERRYNAKGALVNISEATVKLLVDGEEVLTAAEGNGPVNALDSALRKGLSKHFPVLKDILLTDFKVRILNSNEGTGAITRVMVESRDGKGNIWTTLGVSSNLIDAAFDALHDSVTYRLLKK
ncbi:MAG: citramalate synthase [Alphaproteobacteria bacterium]|nr:citramalate synthase [Alphaproteobacteria bacterium]